MIELPTDLLDWQSALPRRQSAPNYSTHQRATSNQQPPSLGNSFDTYTFSYTYEDKRLTQPEMLQTCTFTMPNDKPGNPNPSRAAIGNNFDTYTLLYPADNKPLTKIRMLQTCTPPTPNNK